MSAASGIRAGKAYVELGTKEGPLLAGLSRAEAKIRAFGNAIQATGVKMLGIGLGIAAPLGMAVKAYADMGSEMLDMSQRTGVAVEALSELKYAAEQSGASMEELENGIKFMQRGGFGRGADDLARIADELSDMSDPAQRTARAMEIFGRAGTRLLPLLTSGSAGINQLREEARRLGISMSTTDAEAAESFGDTMSQLKAQLKMVAFAIGGALVPSLRLVTNILGPIISNVREFIDANRWVAVVMALVAADFMFTGLRLIILGPIIRMVAGAIGALTAVLRVLRIVALGAWGVFLAIKSGAVLGAIVSIGASIAGFLLGPLGLVVAAVVGIGVAFARSAEGARAFSAVSQGLVGIGQTVSEAFGGIAAALSSGNLQGALQIAILGLRVVWLQGLAAMRTAWGEFTSWLSTTWVGDVANVISRSVQGWQAAINAIRGQNAPDANREAFLRQTADARAADRERAMARNADAQAEAAANPGSRNRAQFAESTANAAEAAIVAANLANLAYQAAGNARNRPEDQGAQTNAENAARAAQEAADAAFEARQLLNRPDGSLNRTSAVTDQTLALAQRAQAALDRFLAAPVRANESRVPVVDQAANELAEAQRALREEIDRQRNDELWRQAELVSRPVVDPGMAVEQAHRRFDVASTFSAAGVPGLGAGSMSDLMRENNRLTQQIANDTRAIANNGAGFAAL